MTNRNLVIENARVFFKNFSGEPDMYNPQGGKRQFAVEIPNDIVEAVKADGWNVKLGKPWVDKETGELMDPDNPDRYLMYINYQPNSKKRPNVTLITGKKRIKLCGGTNTDPDAASVLDHMRFSQVDLVIRPYDHGGSGTGRSAYLETGFFTQELSPLEEKYANLDYEDAEF